MLSAAMLASLRELSRRQFKVAVIAPVLLFVFLLNILCMKWMSAMNAASIISEYAKLDSDDDQFRPCVMQLYGDRDLRKGTSVRAAGARLSLTMANEYARKQDMSYYLYDCMGLGTCGKAPAIRDACYKQQCTHVLYVDADVLLHDVDTDIVRHLARTYPKAVFMMGIDYYNTMKDQTWHDGKQRMYRTDSNSGMIQFKCRNRLSKRILADWERLCRRFSVHGSDQEAATLMETFPQYEHVGAFARDALMLGTYSIVARHFPGHGHIKSREYPLPNDPEFAKKKEAVQLSGLYKWINSYWKTARGKEVPDTEKWRLDASNEDGWSWSGPSFKKCPMNQGNYVLDLLRSLDLDYGRNSTLKQSLDLLNEGWGF